MKGKLPRKPRLTEYRAECLSAAAGHLLALSQVMAMDDDLDQKAESDKVANAADYCRDLAAWHRARQKAKRELSKEA